MTPRKHDDLEPAAFRRLEAILDEALDLSAVERGEYLDRACAGDAVLRGRVEALLAADAGDDPLLDGSIGPVAAQLLAELVPPDDSLGLTGRRFGAWRAVREIGRGGMGTVWLGERADGAFEQRVAIKVVPAALASRELRTRFDRERRILARLEHSRIARLLDGGVTEEGLPWLAMEYVEGEPVTRWCERRAASLPERLDLFEAIADAVAAAHQRLVVHRDLKPANILVTASGEPRLLDFGIARLLDPALDDDETLTTDRRLTPRYAAPEQLRGEPPTTATDVWALGVLLYQLLAGRHPFGDDGAGPGAVQRAVLETDPPPPGTAHDPAAVPGVSAGAVRGDLDAIVMQALTKEPERRYASAQAMLDDLRRHRTGRPVRAVPPTWRYRSARFLRRNRAAVIAGSLVALALVAGLLATSWQARIAGRERDRARRMLDFLVSTLGSAGPERMTAGFGVTGSADPDRPVQALVRDAARRAEREFAGDPVALGRLEVTLGEVLLAMRRDREADTVLAEAEHALDLARLPVDRHGAMHLRALALGYQARHAEAESILRTVVAYRRSRPGKPVDLAAMLVALAAAQRAQHDTAAIATLDEALDLLVGRVSDAHPVVLEARNTQALLWAELGRFAQAESLIRRCLPLIESAHGPDHPRAITMRSNLANALYSQEHWAAAESVYREVLADRVRTLGPDHPDLDGPLNSLAMCARERGRLAEADSLFRVVIAMRTRHHGPEARQTLASQSGLATVLRLRGRSAESEGIVRRVLAIRRRDLPPNDPLVASSLLALGEALAVQGRWREAEAAIAEALSIREAAAIPSAKEIAKARAALDRIRARRG